MFLSKQTRSISFCAVVLLGLGFFTVTTCSVEGRYGKSPKTVLAASQTNPTDSDCPANPQKITSDNFLTFMRSKQTAAMARKCPDEFTWLVIAYITNTRPAVEQRKVPFAKDGSADTSNDEEWETWADDDDLFNKNPPVWSDSRQTSGVNLKKGTLHPDGRSRGLAATPRARTPRAFHTGPFPVTGCSDDGVCIEVRHNQQDFDSIVSNHLWSVQGLAAAVKPVPNPAPLAQDQDQASIYVPIGQHIDEASIEIKTQWKKLPCNTKASCDEQKKGYHWNYDAKSNLYGLVAMDIITKVLPTWTWATFEWKGNPGLCNFYGCRDSFGGVNGETTMPATLSKSVTNILPGGENSEWQNYRLKGTQIDFCLDKSMSCDTDHATKLGNSLLESGVPGGQSSCISCHALASVDKYGNPADHQVFIGNNQSFLGAPKILPNTYPIGFIWSIKNALCQPAGCADVSISQVQKPK